MSGVETFGEELFEPDDGAEVGFTYQEENEQRELFFNPEGLADLRIKLARLGSPTGMSVERQLEQATVSKGACSVNIPWSFTNFARVVRAWNPEQRNLMATLYATLYAPEDAQVATVTIPTSVA